MSWFSLGIHCTISILSTMTGFLSFDQGQDPQEARQISDYSWHTFVWLDFWPNIIKWPITHACTHIHRHLRNQTRKHLICTHQYIFMYRASTCWSKIRDTHTCHMNAILLAFSCCIYTKHHVQIQLPYIFYTVILNVKMACCFNV